MPLQGSLQIKSAAHRQALGVCIILVAITWVVFGQTIRYDFVNYDDNEYVYANPAITSGLTLHGITYAFSGRHAKNWHPLTTLSHMLDCQLWGVRAGGHHFTNVVFHTIAVVLLFLVLKQMTGAIWQSAFVAALFAVHPLRVESVAWISERKDVLSGLFFMLTLWADVGYVEKSKVQSLKSEVPDSRIKRHQLIFYILALVTFTLGLMSKPMLVTLPVILLLLDVWP